jgi:hypothetical protein
MFLMFLTKPVRWWRGLKREPKFKYASAVCVFFGALSILFTMLSLAGKTWATASGDFGMGLFSKGYVGSDVTKVKFCILFMFVAFFASIPLEVLLCLIMWENHVTKKTAEHEMGRFGHRHVCALAACLVSFPCMLAFAIYASTKTIKTDGVSIGTSFNLAIATWLFAAGIAVAAGLMHSNEDPPSRKSSSVKKAMGIV